MRGCDAFIADCSGWPVNIALCSLEATWLPVRRWHATWSFAALSDEDDFCAGTALAWEIGCTYRVRLAGRLRRIIRRACSLLR